MKKTTLILITIIMICRLLPGNDPAYGNPQVSGMDCMLAQADNPLTASRTFKGWPIQVQEEKNFLLSLQVSYLQPLGDFTKIAGPGVSLLFGASYRGLLLDNLVLGAETGFFFISPADDNITMHMLVPLYLTAAYDVSLLWDLWLTPKLGFGYSYTMLFYDEYNADADSLEGEMDSAFEPMLMMGLGLSYRGFERLSLSLDLCYYGIIEEGGPIHILSVSLGAGIRL